MIVWNTGIHSKAIYFSLKVTEVSQLTFHKFWLLFINCWTIFSFFFQTSVFIFFSLAFMLQQLRSIIFSSIYEDFDSWNIFILIWLSRLGPEIICSFQACIPSYHCILKIYKHFFDLIIVYEKVYMKMHTTLLFSIRGTLVFLIIPPLNLSSWLSFWF